MSPQSSTRRLVTPSRSRQAPSVDEGAFSAAQLAALLDTALAPVRDQLEAVGARVLASLHDPVATTVVYLITAGGKRLRPALVLLAGAAGAQPRREALQECAAAVELIHTATLIHDDIIDQAAMRRSQPSFHGRWGTERAVLMGDYLYATAFTLLAKLEAPCVVETLSRVCQELCRGELREVEARFRLDLTEAEYFDIIRDKTASLIGGCCRTGAYLGGCTPDVIERLTVFGINYGLAFQIVDDCLDLTGDQRQLGKSVLADLDKGALSLPIIYLAQRISATERRTLFAPLRTRATDPVFLRRLAKAAQATGAVRDAHARAKQLIDEAQAQLEQGMLNTVAATYRALGEYAIGRRS